MSKGELPGADANFPQDEAIRQDNDDAPEVTDVDSGHVERRTIVLPGRRILYVPNLKGGCTSLMWMLADLAGLRARRFERSPLGAVSRAMTIHTMAAWPERYRWSELPAEARHAITHDDSWLRFTTLRDPKTRLWSAWQSKLLLREPGFVGRFGGEPWYPRVPVTARDVIDDFRRFVRALGTDSPPYDAHWAPQTDLLTAAPPLNHVGRLEALDGTLARIREHVGPDWDKVRSTDENKSLLRYHDGLFDEETVEIVNSYYAVDFAELGYPPLDLTVQGSLDDWSARASVSLNGIAALCRCHERIDDLHKQARGVSRLRDEVAALRVENARLESWINASSQTVAT